jgi:GntR family transcriptional regulator
LTETLPAGRRRASHETHYEQAKQALEDLAVELAKLGKTRLPAEDRLADEIGFSRPTVRSALLAMQMEGKVLRLHGVGTFINRHVFDIKANVAEDLPFLEVIERLGYEASLDIVRLADEPIPASIARRCGVPDERHGIVIDRLFRASGKPAVLSRDYVPSSFLVAPVAELTAERSTFCFLRRWSGRPIRYSVAEIRALAAPEHVATPLELAAGDAVLLLDHLHIDENDEVVGITQAYVNDDIVGFSVVRSGADL